MRAQRVGGRCAMGPGAAESRTGEAEGGCGRGDEEGQMAGERPPRETRDWTARVRGLSCDGRWATGRRTAYEAEGVRLGRAHVQKMEMGIRDRIGVTMWPICSCR